MNIDDYYLDEISKQMVPIFGIYSHMTLTEEEKVKVLKIIKKLSDRVSEVIGSNFDITIIDMIGDKKECTKSEHALAVEDGKIFCTHCLKQFKLAKDTDIGFLTNNLQKSKTT